MRSWSTIGNSRCHWFNSSVTSSINCFVFSGLYNFLLGVATNNRTVNQTNLFLTKFLFELSVLWISTCLFGLIVGKTFMKYLHKTQVTDIIFPLKLTDENFSADTHTIDEGVIRLLPSSLKLIDNENEITNQRSNFDGSTTIDEYGTEHLHQYDELHLEINRSTQDTLSVMPLPVNYSIFDDSSVYYPLAEYYPDSQDQICQLSFFKIVAFVSLEGIGLLIAQFCLLLALQASNAFQWGVIFTLAYSDSLLKPLMFYYTKNLCIMILFGSAMIVFMVLVTLEYHADQKLVGLAFFSGLVATCVSMLIYNKTNNLISRNYSYLVRYVVQGGVGLSLCICLICYSTTRQLLFSQIYFTTAPAVQTIKENVWANRFSLFLFVSSAVSHSCFVWYLNKTCAESLTVAERLLKLLPFCSFFPMLASVMQTQSFNQRWLLLLIISWIIILGISMLPYCTSFKSSEYSDSQPIRSFTYFLPRESATKMVSSSPYIMLDST